MYKILRARYSEDLEKLVLTDIEGGWDVLGGGFHNGEAYCQCLIKKPQPKATTKSKPRAKAGGTKK